jgi:hypothetical protein
MERKSSCNYSKSVSRDFSDKLCLDKKKPCLYNIHNDKSKPSAVGNLHLISQSTKKSEVKAYDKFFSVLQINGLNYFDLKHRHIMNLKRM